MAAMDAGSRQSIGLPSINHLDPDRVKREEMDYQRKHSAPTMPSPLHPYSAPPPHLHAPHQSSTASAVSGSLGGLLSPPESRRTSGDEEPQRPAATRQSLPSIHEALGAEQHMSYPATVPPPPASAPVPAPYVPQSANPSPTDTRPRHFTSEPHPSQGPTNPFSHPRSPYIASAPQVPPPPPHPQPQSESLQRPSYSDPRPPYSTPQHNPKLPTLYPLKTAQSPSVSAAQPSVSYPSYPSSSTAYESPVPPPAVSMNNHHPYPSYPPSHPLSAASASTPNSAYSHPPAAYSAPPRYPQQSWRDHNSDLAYLEEKKINRSSLAPYGEAVKRHLDGFELEASLNEMADGSGHISEFSNKYRQRAHENHRIGVTPGSIPRMEEVDEMIRHNDRINTSLQRLRDVVIKHHQATIVQTPQDSHYRSLNGYDADTASNYGDDAKGGGGFANGDNKSRKRGRAAPPGRCHSCNRAETPEWRRGPDGARTLCNACGLHYAKLTRKMGGKQAMASSNLRPKSIDHGSPAM